MKTEKRCPHCEQTLPASRFYQAPSQRDGLTSYCTECMKARARHRWANASTEQLEERRAKARERARDRAVNDPKYQEQKRAWYQANKDRARESALRNRYGITPADYEEMLERQGGACAICRTAPEERKLLHVDHCHETGAVRGLLCQSCNTALGQLGDTIDGLRRALAYLEAGA